MPVDREATKSRQKMDDQGWCGFIFPDGKRISFPMDPVLLGGFGCEPDERKNNTHGTIYIPRRS